MKTMCRSCCIKSEEEKDCRSDYINILDRTICMNNAPFKCDCCVFAFEDEKVLSAYDELQAYYIEQGWFLDSYERFLRDNHDIFGTYTKKYIEENDTCIKEYSELAFALLERIREEVNNEKCLILYKLERLFDTHDILLKKRK